MKNLGRILSCTQLQLKQLQLKHLREFFPRCFVAAVAHLAQRMTRTLHTPRPFVMVTMPTIACVLSFVLSFFLSSCDGGLQLPPPDPPPTTVSGVITYRGGRASWPPADSVVTVRIAAFKSLPTASAGIINAVLSRDAFFAPEALVLDSTLTKFADSTRYTIVIGEPVPEVLNYIAVVILVDPAAVTNTTALFNPRSWRVVGVYTTSGDNRQPSPLRLRAGTDHRADITVDFRNLPPQPF